MEFDFGVIPGRARDKLMHALVLPRPIALVSTVGLHGLNIAPFSFFNVFSGDPALVGLGVVASQREGDGLKDTAYNILDTREFVVSMVNEDLLDSIHIAALEFPRGRDESIYSHLSTVPSSRVRPPRVEQSPAALECRLTHSIAVEGGNHIFVAEVLAAHVDEIFIEDAERHYIDVPALGLVARMHGGSWYSRTTDLFSATRPRLEDVDDPACETA